LALHEINQADRLTPCYGVPPPLNKDGFDACIDRDVLWLWRGDCLRLWAALAVEDAVGHVNLTAGRVSAVVDFAEDRVAGSVEDFADLWRGFVAIGP
jgi:hypothetical protein